MSADLNLRWVSLSLNEMGRAETDLSGQFARPRPGAVLPLLAEERDDELRCKLVLNNLNLPKLWRPWVAVRSFLRTGVIITNANNDGQLRYESRPQRKLSGERS